MEFLIEVLWALLMAGVPIGIFTLALVWWALRGGHFKETQDSGGLKREMQAMGKKNKKGKQENPVYEHPLQKKWARFGGGFYGIVAFFTYIVVEVLEITAMIMEFGGIMDFLGQLNPGVIISMIVDALTNFVSAMVWPVYWMGRIETHYIWVWFAVAYGGYWVGWNMARSMFRRSKAPAA